MKHISTFHKSFYLWHCWWFQPTLKILEFKIKCLLNPVLCSNNILNHVKYWCHITWYMTHICFSRRLEQVDWHVKDLILNCITFLTGYQTNNTSRHYVNPIDHANHVDHVNHVDNVNSTDHVNHVNLMLIMKTM